jgi:regulatory factor X
MPSQTGHNVDRAAFPSPDIPQMPEPKRRRSDGLVKPHSVYHHPEITSISQLESTTQKIPQRLKFAPSPGLSMDYTNLTLPSIEAFVPAGTDMDSASALTALYRSHCNSLVDALRFCKEKTFFHLYTSFHGTLTMPVQKLFANPSIAPWIEECDFVVYQMMMDVIAPLTLQVVPKPVLDTLRAISVRLVIHIQDSFHGHPSHVIEAKSAPAALFASLLDRLLRVNLTAHAAANMLSNPANRDQMYEDWIHQVRTRKVVECIPTRGMDDVVSLLLTDLRDLLDPVNVTWESEGMTPYGEMAMRTGRQQLSTIHEGSTTQNVLDRWLNFLHALPSKFPYATPAEIVWCVQSLGTAVMRDITIQQGKSFGSWWVTKCWIDEEIAFLAEQGGFMEYKTSQFNHDDTAPNQAASRAASVHGSRYSSGSDEFLRASGNADMSTSRPADDSVQTALSTSGHDDSGIGIRTPDEDFSMAKFDSFGAEHPLQPHGMNHGLPQPAVL